MNKKTMRKHYETSPKNILIDILISSREEVELEHKDKEIERLKEDNEYLNKVNIELSTEKNRLNNIINELEKYIGAEWYCFDNESVEFEVAKDILNKLQELKGSDKE